MAQNRGGAQAGPLTRASARAALVDREAPYYVHTCQTAQPHAIEQVFE